jgi:transposase
MKSKNVSPKLVSQSEAQFLERLRQHPEMMERVQSILDIAYNTEGPLKSADQIEELLIQEMRRLGNTSMHQWATQAEQRVSRELKAQDGTVRSRKKKR